MLAVSPLRNITTRKDENQGQMESFSGIGKEDYADFSDGSLLESINFDDIFVGINDGDVLPDLDMDPEILAELSASGGDCGEGSEISTPVSDRKVEDSPRISEEEDKVSGSGSGSDSGLSTKGQEIVSRRVQSVKEGAKGRKSLTQAKNNQGKKKVKVDWTPELHRRFLQAVEQLGVDKAVPSRILELMGIDCLTRHNIASHLQKYRSHRKHLLARDAEAASWSPRLQIYGSAAAGGCGKNDIRTWNAPTMGFPPITPLHHPFRPPLHVWGHPSMDPSLFHMWPKRPTLPPPPHVWPPPPPDHAYWHHNHQQRAPNGLTSGTPCYPPPLLSPRFATALVPGIPPHTMFKSEPGIGVPAGKSGPHPDFDFHPSKESVDAAIGDVLSKPWLPLPLGLKPPAVDCVLVELQRQGIQKIPPTCA